MEQKILKLIGVKGTFKGTVVPMMNYSCANITTSGAGYVISLYFMGFLTDVINLDPKLAGLVTTIAVVWDAITDPVMGILTDRTRSKYGKHRRYILWGMPLFCISFALLWNSYGLDGAANPKGTFIYFMIVYMLYKTAYTIIDIPHVAMLPELAPDYDLRTQYNSVGYIFNSFGMFPSFFFFMIVLGIFGFDAPSAGSNKPMLIVGVSLAVLYGIFLTNTFLKTREKPSLDLKLEKFDFRFFIQEYVYVFKNKAFREYFFMSLCYNIANNFYNTSLYYYIKYIAGLIKFYGLFNIVAGAFEAGAFPFNYAMTMKHGKKKCGSIVTPFMIIGFAVCLLMNPREENKSSFIWVVILMLTAIFYPFGKSGLGYVAQNILPDVSDVDELITGRRREGVIGTFNTFIKKSISGVMQGAVMFILGAFGLMMEKDVKAWEELHGVAYQQTDTAILGVRLCVAIIPIIFALISLFLLYKFKMNKSEHTVIRAAVATKHKYGTVSLTEEEIAIMENISGQKFENTWLGKNNNPDEYRPLEKDAEGRYIVLVEKEAEMAAIRAGKKPDELEQAKASLEKVKEALDEE